MKSIRFKLLLAFVSLAGLLLLLSGCQQAVVKEPPKGTSVKSSASQTEPQKSTESLTQQEDKNNIDHTFATTKATEAIEGVKEPPETSERATEDTKADFSQNTGGIVLPDDNWE